MIDFRYHIVSIVAVFIALAVGIVLGSGPLEDDISGFLEDRTKALAAEKLALQQDVAALEDELADQDSYAELVQPAVLQGLLSGTPVVLVSLPGASDGDRDAVAAALQAAGATVVEQVRIDASWTDPEQATVLARVTEGVSREPAGGDVYADAAQAVADVLVTPSVRLVGEPAPGGVATLGAYAEAGFLEVEDAEQVTLAGAAVVVASDAADVDAAGQERQATSLLPLVAALDDGSSGSVVVGPRGSAQPNGMVTAVRDSDAADVVSTVDWLPTSAGETVAALALVEQLQGGVGHYGTGDGAEGVGPSPVPGGG